MPEQQEMQQRQVAYKVRIGDLINGEYIEQEGWQPNYIRVGDKQISRVNVIASVIDKEIGASLGSLTLDDGSGNIQIRAFKEDSAELNDLEIGNVIIAIGRPRKYGNQFFISYEIVKKLDPLWAKVRQNELGIEPTTIVRSAEPQVNSVQGDVVKEEKVVDDSYENKRKILDSIKSIDNGDGAEIEGVIVNSGLDKKEAEEIVQELIKAGEIYENVAGKVKLL
ncbi:MAG: hypothetical protein CMH62_03780 [Nanoarchaeota archaeon]|nr:hypothetical protein [Nanoarchaeota archaeon]|tara:strand:- start:713 stop:1381 length:669 start_codon:yes stop_codon:yes gene_type:complete